MEHRTIIKRISQLIALTFITQIIISWRLWTPLEREFPKMSAYSWLNFSFNPEITYTLLLILAVSLLLIALNKQRKKSIIVVLICLGILILEDINRLQPWIYIQGCILFYTTLLKKGREKLISKGLLVFLSLTYIWSGIQKLNLGFLKETFPWFISPLGFNYQIDVNAPLQIAHYLFLLAPLLEISIGVLLLFHKRRKIGIIFGILMHIFIILMLSPLGHNWNTIVWVWNLSLIFFLITFIKYKENHNLIPKRAPKKTPYIILLLYGLLPLFNFFGCVDDSLSLSMYSGTHDNVVFYFDAQEELKIPVHQTDSALTKTTLRQQHTISETWFMYWSINDLNTPYYSATRYYKRYGTILCKKISNPLSSGIKIIKRSKFTGKKTTTQCSCIVFMED